MKSSENIISPFLIDPKTNATVSTLNFVRVTYPFRVDKSLTGCYYSTLSSSEREKDGCKSPDWADLQVPGPPSVASCRPPPGVQELTLNPERTTETPWVTEIQVGGGGMEHGTPAGEPPQAIPQCRKNPRQSNAVRVHLPPAAVREVRNFQNLFLFHDGKKRRNPWNQKRADEAELRPEGFPEVCCEGSFVDCCGQDNCKKYRCLVDLGANFSAETSS